MRKLLLLIWPAVLLMTGCCANGPAFVPLENSDPNQAVIYIYRPFSTTYFVYAPKVLVDEIEYGTLQNNGYIACAVKPGKRIIETKGVSPKPLTIYADIEKGAEYYFRWWVEVEGAYTMTAAFQLAAMKPEFGLTEIQQTKKCQ